MASVDAAVAGAAPSIGRVFGRAFDVIRADPVAVLGNVLLLQALPTVILTLVRAPLRGGVATTNAVLGNAAVSVGLAFVSLLFIAAAKAAVIRAVIAHEEGRRATFGAGVAAGLRSALPLFGLSVLITLGTALGFVLLVVPGIMLALMWSVAAPVLVVERTGVLAAAGRSRFLTKGARWRIFALGLVVLVVLYGIMTVLALMAVPGLFGGAQASIAMRTPSLGYAIGNAAVTAIVLAWWYAVQASLYLELRAWKEGPSLAALRDTFA